MPSYTPNSLPFHFTSFLAIVACLGACERRTVVVVAPESTPLPMTASASRTDTHETRKLALAVERFESEPTAENAAAVKKARADLDGEIAELEERVARTTGDEREEAAMKQKNLTTYRDQESARFAALQAKAPLIPGSDAPARVDDRAAGEKIETTARDLGDRAQDAAHRAKEAIKDVVR